MLLTSVNLLSSRTAPSMSPTPQPPPETTTMRPCSGRPSARRACKRTARPEEVGRDQRTHEAHAALPGDPLDRRHRLAVHHQVHVDPGLRPEEQARQVGDRRHRRAVDHFGAPQPRQHDRHGRVGGDDHVGVVLGDAPSQRARAQQPQQPARKPADRRDVLEQPVDERVRPRHQAQLHAIAVLDHRPQHPPHRGEAVDDRDLGLLGRVLDLIGQRPRGGGMTLADVGGQDQDTARAGGIRNRVCGFAVSTTSHRSNLVPRAGRAAQMHAHSRIAPGEHGDSYRVLSTPKPCRSPRRNNGRVQATTPLTGLPRRARESAGGRRHRRLGAIAGLDRARCAGSARSACSACSRASCSSPRAPRAARRNTFPRAAGAGRAGWRARSRASAWASARTASRRSR